MKAVSALIVDDEPLLRERLRAHLAQLWPDLQVIADARNGEEALELIEQQAPDIVFLDIHMPGRNGIEVARALARRAHLVFVTAYEQYALQAFEQGAIDYLVKPIDPERLADTIGRLRERVLHSGPAPAALDAVLQHLAARVPAAGHQYLHWIKASVANSVRLIPVDQVHYLRAEDKYTVVAWSEGDALIRKSIRELVAELDPVHFVQTHRSVIVNLRAVVQVVRGMNETAELHLRGRREVLPVSRNFLHHFRQM